LNVEFRLRRFRRGDLIFLAAVGFEWDFSEKISVSAEEIVKGCFIPARRFLNREKMDRKARNEAEESPVERKPSRGAGGEDARTAKFGPSAGGREENGKVAPGPDIDGKMEILIRPRAGWKIIDFKELRQYRDLFFFLVWRDIKVLYAQTILGFAWAILQPLIQIVIFTVVFGKVAKVSTEGLPYIVFSSAAIIPWTYMSQAITASSQSLISGQHMLGKVYFPRLIFPITPILAKMVDFAISMLIVVGVAFYFNVRPTWNLALLPIFVLMMMGLSAGAGMWLSSMAIRFRDVKHAMPFVIRMLMYTAPIVYSASTIPDQYRFYYSLNPLVGVVEGFRASLLGTPIPWDFIWPGIISAFILFVGGTMYFRKMERVFVDVI
jgi:lipopolysaccharide transport system permease protein